MRINRQWEGEQSGYPLLYLEIDGKRAVLGVDNKRTILENHNAVFLGSQFEGYTYVDIPAAPNGDHGPERLNGFTNDPEIIAIYREWLAQHGG